MTSREAVLRFLERHKGEFYYPREVSGKEPDYSRSRIRAVLAELYHEGKLERFEHRYRRPGEQELWRYSLAVTFPLHGVPGKEGPYYGAVIEAWSANPELLRLQIGMVKTVLAKALGEFTKSKEYGREIVIDGQGSGVQSVPFKKGLAGTYEWRIEKERGGVLAEGEGEF